MKKQLTIAVGIALGVATLAVVATQILHEPAAPPIVRPADSARAPRDPAEAWLASLPRTPDGPIEWDGDELKADIVDEPAAQAIAQLAAATHSVVTGAELMRAEPALTMHWRARDATSAWQQLLASRAEYDIRCEASSCRVRITKALGVAPTVVAPSPARTTAPKTDNDTTPSQPDGAC